MANRPADYDGVAVNEHEGAVLALIARSQPVTRYRLVKLFSEIPTTSYNASKGGLYPLVARLIERGLVSSEIREVPRGTEVLSLTGLGYQALSSWIAHTGAEHPFTHDSYLLRVMSLGDVTWEERIRWVANAKRLLVKKRTELEDFQSSVDASYANIVRGTALALIDTRLEWLDRLMFQIVDEEPGLSPGREPRHSP